MLVHQGLRRNAWPHQGCPQRAGADHLREARRNPRDHLAERPQMARPRVRRIEFGFLPSEHHESPHPWAPRLRAVQLPGRCVCTCHARGAPHLQNRPSRLPHGRHPLVSPPQPPLSGRAGRWWLFRSYHRGRPQRRITKGVRGHGREGRHDKLDRWELDYQCQWCVRPASSGTNGDGPFVEVTWEVCELPGYCRAGQRSVQAEDDDRRQQQVVPLSNRVRNRRARAVYLPLVQ
mmetsp:Transcript_82650/g.266537  ORF Transcript_82650/g.266537 Transcript_82650/m.266537 type:complete len:233 (+) Transcript_82650:408-1106(+)